MNPDEFVNKINSLIPSIDTIVDAGNSVSFSNDIINSTSILIKGADQFLIVEDAIDYIYFNYDLNKKRI